MREPRSPNLRTAARERWSFDELQRRPAPIATTEQMVKIIFMTGYSRNAIVHQGRLDPGIEMIQKPMSQRELAGRIRDMLDAAPRSKTPPRRRGPKR